MEPLSCRHNTSSYDARRRLEWQDVIRFTVTKADSANVGFKAANLLQRPAGPGRPRRGVAGTWRAELPFRI